MKKLTFLFLTFLCTTSIFATTITWTGNGANKLWSNTANWDSGTVPGQYDIVIIPTGMGNVKFNYNSRKVKNIEVRSNSKLTIGPYANLEIIGTAYAGLNNDGTVVVKGTLTIIDAGDYGIYNTGIFRNRGGIKIKNTLGTGFRNTGTFINEPDAILSFLAWLSYGMENMAGSTVTNNGDIIFQEDGSGYGLAIGGDLVNSATGTINLDGDNHGGILCRDGSNIQNYGIVNVNNADGVYTGISLTQTAYWFNHQSSSVYIWGALSTGLSLSLGARFENAGVLQVNNLSTTTTGISLYSGNSVFINHLGGTTAVAFFVTGIFVCADCELENYDVLTIADNDYSLSNYGETTNHAGADLNVDGPGTGLYNEPGGTFENAGIMTLGVDLHNEGVFTNQACGYLELLYIRTSTGAFLNYGWIELPSFGVSYPGGGTQVINYGVFNDPNERFTNLIFNQKIWIKPLGDMQANIGYPNALDIVVLGNFSISDWYLKEDLSTLAGVYDPISNTFYPNINAVDAEYLYAEFTDLSNNCSRIMAMKVDGTISPITNSPSESFDVQKSEDRSAVIEKAKQSQVFPNPSNGRLQIQLPDLAEGQIEIRLIDINGRIVWQAHKTARALLSLDFSQQASSGIYVLQVWQNGQLIGQKRVMLENG